MKKIWITIIITIGFFTTNAQEFKATEKYTVMNERLIGQEEEQGSALIDLVLSDDSSNIMATLEIAELDLLEEIQISTLRTPEMDDFTEVLKVELAYLACCMSTDVYYFLVAENKTLTALPRIENVYCSSSETDTHYIFPNQEYGQEGTILRAQKHYDEIYEVEAVQVIQSIVLNDDDFDYEEAISAIN